MTMYSLGGFKHKTDTIRKYVWISRGNDVLATFSIFILIPCFYWCSTIMSSLSLEF